MSLAGGSGWCVLVYNLHTRSLHNHWAWDHMHGAIAGVPLLALDMYEHSENTGNKRGHGSAGSTGLKMGQSC